MPDESSFHPPDEEFKQRGEQFAERASQLLEKIKEVEAGVTHDALASLSYFLQSQACYAELNRREAIRRADRDRKHNEKIEKRDFWMEVGVMVLIGLEIALSIYYGQRGLREGKEQGAILEQMNKNTKDTAAQIQRAADAMTQTLQVLQADRADRLAQLAKSPKLVLYVGHVPLLKRHATFTPTQETDSSVTYHLDLWNRGDITANRLYLRVLVSSKDVTTYSNPGALAPEPDPTDPSVQTFILAQVFVRSHSYFPVDIIFAYQKGHAPFQVTFKTDSEESRTPTFLGVLPVNPRTPSK